MTPTKYPWLTWLNGEVHIITPPEGYTRAAFARLLRQTCKQRVGARPFTEYLPDGTIKFRALYGAKPAPVTPEFLLKLILRANEEASGNWLRTCRILLDRLTITVREDVD